MCIFPEIRSIIQMLLHSTLGSPSADLGFLQGPEVLCQPLRITL